MRAGLEGPKGTTGMKKPFMMQRRVELADTDMAGIVHFSAYFRYAETAEHEFFREGTLRICGNLEIVGHFTTE